MRPFLKKKENKTKFKTSQEPRRMAQFIKALTAQTWRPEFKFPPGKKKSDLALHAFNPSTGRVRWMLRAHWPASLAALESFSVTEAESDRESCGMPFYSLWMWSHRFTQSMHAPHTLDNKNMLAVAAPGKAESHRPLQVRPVWAA